MVDAASARLALASSKDSRHHTLGGSSVVGKWVGVVFFNRAEVSCLAIDAGPLDCFVIGDGEVIRRSCRQDRPVSVSRPVELTNLVRIGDPIMLKSLTNHNVKGAIK